MYRLFVDIFNLKPARSILSAACIVLAGCSVKMRRDDLIVAQARVSIGTLSSVVAGGTVLSISYNLEHPEELAFDSIEFQYAEDGINFVKLSDLTQTSGSYIWNVPVVNAPQAKVRIRSVDETGTVTTLSSPYFAIDKDPPTVTLTSLTGGQTIGGGATTAIQWNASDAYLGATPISLEVSSNSGTSWSTIASNLTNSGSYAWNVPLVNSTTYRVRVKATDRAGHVSTSASGSDFTINASSPIVTVTAPNGGEYFRGNFATTITWTVSGTPPGNYTADVDYSADGGATWTSIATGLVNGTSQAWTTPNVDDNDFRVRVRVTDSSSVVTTDTSDSNFVIDKTLPVIAINTVNSPLKGGATEVLQWTLTELNASSSQNFTVEKSSDGGSTWAALATVAAANGPLSAQPFTYNWTVDSWNTTNARIRVTYSDLAGNASTTVSNTFTVDSTAPTVTFTPPAIVRGGAANTLNFSFADTGGSGLAATVTLQYAADGVTFSNVSTSIASGATSYNWTPPADNVATAKLRWIVADNAGNVTTDTSAAFIVDSLAPTVDLTSLDGGQVVKPNTTYAITWTATDVNGFIANPIKIEYSKNGGTWTTLIAATDNDGTHNWTVPLADANGTTYQFRISATDTVGNIGIDTGTDIYVDAAGPVFTAGTFQINGNAATSANNSVTIAVTAVDDYSRITHFCFKDSTSAPASSDPCFLPVESWGGSKALSVALTNARYTLEFVPGTYDVYAWAKDELGYISTLTNAGAGTALRDKETITYDPGVAASFINVIAANTSTPSSPVALSELSAPSGSTVYIQWQVSDDEPLPANPIKLYYTTDESTYVAIATNLANGSNGGCTVTGSYTGCYTWTNGSPTNSYLRIRVGVTDADGLTSYGAAPALNTGNFRVIAGNMDSGVNGSASAAFFYTQPGQLSFDPYALAVARDGTVYINDDKRGIMKIDPITRDAVVYIPKTGVMAPDNTAIASMTALDPLAIQLDYDDVLYVWDNNRIRKVDVAQNKIYTIIGGGATTSNTIASALSLRNDYWTDSNLHAFSGSAFHWTILPNGNHVFSSDNYWNNTFNGTTVGRVRIYDSGSGSISTVIPSGTGIDGNSGAALTSYKLYNFGIRFDLSTSAITDLAYKACSGGCGNNSDFVGFSVDPTTGVSLGAGAHIPRAAAGYANDVISTDSSRFTGKNGDLYQYTGKNVYLEKHSSATNTWSHVAGLQGIYSYGYSADGTAATSALMKLKSAYVSTQGRVFLMDEGMVRTIDKNGNLKTIYGQQSSYGDGGVPTNARIGQIEWLEKRNSGGTVFFIDTANSVYREFVPGSTIQRIAGNYAGGMPGLYGGAVNALTQPAPMLFLNGYGYDPATGDVFSQTNPGVGRLNRATGKWESFLSNIGSPSACYMTNDGGDGRDLNPYAAACDTGSMTDFMGVGNNQLISPMFRVSSGNRDGYIKLFDVTTRTQSHLMGATGLFGFSGTTLCADGSTTSTCNVFPSGTGITRAWWDSAGSRYLMSGRTSNTIRTVTPGGTIGTLTTLAGRQINAFAYRPSASSAVYVCDYADGNIYKRTLPSTDTTLSLGLSSIKCAGRALHWDDTNKILTFGFELNGLYGVGEYYDP